MPAPTIARADLLSPSQAARLLGVSNFTVQRWLDGGRLRGTHTSLGRLIDAQSVHELVDQQRAAGQPVAAREPVSVQ
jgi:excisionase family DNA binding protein